MPMLEFAITGPDAAQVAEALEAILAKDAAISPERRMAQTDRTGDEKVIDPIALAALVVSIPGAILAVAELADRILKRKKAEDIIAQAKQLIINGNVSITVTINGSGVPVPVQSLTADKLLELANTASQSKNTAK